jgi:hypothetical protein
MIPMGLRAGLAGLFLAAIPALASAGETACRIENGVVVVAAMAAGVNGAFILDTGAPHSQIDATQASEVPILTPVVTGPVRLAGRTVVVTMTVLPLDARTKRFVIPISGVLGSDVLAGLVMDLQAEPCRLRLSAPGEASPFRGRMALPVELRDGVPFVRASVADGRTGRVASFRIDTGSAFPAAFSPDAARLTTADGQAPPPKSLTPGRLRALSFGGALFENQTAGLTSDVPAPAIGAIGAPILARFRLRLDYGRRRLSLAPLDTAAASAPNSPNNETGGPR